VNRATDEGEMVLICKRASIIILIAIILLSGGNVGADDSDQNSDEFTPLFGKMIKLQPISCPDNDTCICLKLSTKTALFQPLRYTYSKWCPEKTDNSHPSIGLWSVTNYNEDWIKVEEGPYSFGKMHGKWIGWYPDGAKEGESSWRNGKQVGNMAAWHEKGQLKAKGFFKNGEMHGKWIQWYPNGTKKLEHYYNNGKWEGLYTSWYDNGQIHAKKFFKNNKKDGEWLDWNRDGQLIKKTIWENGNLISEKEIKPETANTKN